MAGFSPWFSWGSGVPQRKHRGNEARFQWPQWGHFIIDPPGQALSAQKKSNDNRKKAYLYIFSQGRGKNPAFSGFFTKRLQKFCSCGIINKEGGRPAEAEPKKQNK